MAGTHLERERFRLDVAQLEGFVALFRALQVVGARGIARQGNERFARLRVLLVHLQLK